MGNLLTWLQSLKTEAPKLLNRAMESPRTALISVAGGLAVLVLLSNFDVRKNVEIFDWEIGRVSLSTVMLISFAVGAAASWYWLRRND